MKHCNLFIYYGTQIDKIDYENLTNKLGFEMLYKTVFSKGLTFRDVGEIGATSKYVIGKEIAWKINDTIVLDNVNGILSLNDKSITLTEDEENEVRQKLLEINITTYPQYHFFYCWDDYDYVEQ